MTQTTTATSTDWYFDEAAAMRPVKFFNNRLIHPDGRLQGLPFEPLPWQVRVLRDVFGHVYDDPVLGTVRWHKEAYIEIPGKNGKTAWGAGLALYLLDQDGAKNGYVFSVAEDRDQASIVYRTAAKYVEASPVLSKRIRIYKGARVLEHKNGNIWRPLPGDEGSNDGEKAIGVVMDEIHRIKQPGIYDVMKKATLAAKQGLLVSITTAGDESSLLWRDLHDYAVAVRDGSIDNSRFYELIFAASPDDEWDDEEVWKAVNPSIGYAFTVDDLRDIADKARISPARRAKFKRLHLNIPGVAEDGLVDVEAWRACPSDVSLEELGGMSAWIGLDLSTTTDITAAAILVPREEDVACVWRFWMPEEGIDRRGAEDGVPYREWASQGWLTLTPGNVVDYGFIRSELNTLAGNFHLRSIGYDPWNATQLSTELAEEDGLPMVPVRQGFFTLSSPTKMLLKLIGESRLNHGGNPIALWMAGNAVAKEDENRNLKPVKAKSKGRIDGIVALINAISEWERSGMESPVGPLVFDIDI